MNHQFYMESILDRHWYLFCFDLFPTEYKRSRQEIKRKSLDTIKLQKKARKGEKTFQELARFMNLWYNTEIIELILMKCAWLQASGL